MKPKSLKVIKKFFIYFPFALAAGMIFILLWGINPFHWQIGILAGVITCSYFILVNFNDYNSIDDMTLVDFLESKHRIDLQNHHSTLKSMEFLFESQFVYYKILKYNLDELIVKVDNSSIRVKLKNDKIELTIERNFFDFLPDRGRNCKILKKIVKATNILDNKTFTEI